LLLGLAACARPAGDQSAVHSATASPVDQATEAPSAPPPPVGLGVGNTAPDFELVSLDSTKIRLIDLRGQVVLINFWAVWCPYCLIELPEMQEAYDVYQDRGFIVLAVDVRDSEIEVVEFTRDLGMTFPVLMDRDGKVALRYRVSGLPTSLLLDQDGVILAKRVGPIDVEWITQHLAQAGIG